MARAVLKYAFAALLALLTTQAVVPVARAAAAIEFVYTTEAEQQDLQGTRPGQQDPAPHIEPAYISRTRPEPDAADLFQRPPPAGSLFS